MIYIAGLILLEIILFFTNYSPGRYLIGWDNIMPEFNLGLNLTRSVFGVWQDYRGLGVLDGMAQTANLFHTIYIFLLSLILPQDLLRFTFIMLTHLIGGIGFFVFSSYLFKEEIKKTKAKIFCFVGALFYMLNIGVIQMYFAPLEVFAFHFAALPWLALFITKALKKPNPINYIILFIASLLASPQGFVPTVFIVYFIFLLAVSLIHILRTKKFKVAFAVILISILANAFWLLPYIYNGVKTQSAIRNTRINQFSSEEIFYRNKAHGDLKSVLTLKGFMLNSIEYDQAFGGDVLFMLRWLKHYNALLYQIAFILVLAVALIGIIISFTKKNYKLFPHAVSMLIGFIFLANNTLFFAQINDFFRTFVPVLGEAFRFPFTKFIILFTFCFALFFVSGLYSIVNWLNRQKINTIASAIFILVIIYLSFPAFKGQFISPLLRLDIPSNYKKVFSYFSEKNDNGRIAVFPMHSFWNWQYRDWGNRGSGFYWYAIPQPLTERAFDPWSIKNEEFYNEMSNAVDTRNQNLFKDTLLKYNLKYILLDTSVLNSLTRYAINYESLMKFIEESELLSQKKTFGKLIIYEFRGNTSAVFSIDNPKRVYPLPEFQKEDMIFGNLGNYISHKNSFKISYLMPSFFSEKLQEDLDFEIREDKETITLIRKNTKSITLGENSILEIPSLYSAEFLVPFKVKAEGSRIIANIIYPTIYINGKKIEITEPPTVIETGLGNISHITFQDIKYSVPFRDEVIYSYLLNNYPNNIRVGNGTWGESFLIDTSNMPLYKFLIPLSDGKIDDLRIVVRKIKGPYGFDNIIYQNYDLRRNVGGFELYKDKVLSKVAREKDKATFEASGNSSSEMVFSKDNLFHQASYLMLVDSKHESGLPVSFYMDNTFERRPEFETKLSTKKEKNVFIIPKTEDVFSGYGFHFVVKSVGVEKAKAQISRVALYPFPEKTIRSMKILINPESSNISKNTEITQVNYEKLNPSLYKTEFPRGSHLVLSQAYDNGWKAYEVKSSKSKVQSLLNLALPFFFGKELKDHVKVNNWANGWQVDQPSITNDQSVLPARSSSIIIIFLPQYLEYFGLILTISTMVFLTLKLTQNYLFGKINQKTCLHESLNCPKHLISMTKNKPLVSIILPIHNSENYLTDCLSSLLRQSYKNIEIIAIDDNSKDNSYKILRSLSRMDKRIRAFRNIKRYGPAITLNRLVKRSKGSFIAFMDAEDLSLKDRIKKQLDFLQKHNDVVAVGTQCVFIEGKNKRIGKSNFPKHNQDIYQSPLHGISMQFETIMINKNLLPKDVLKFNTKSTTFIYSDAFLKVLPYGKVVNLDDYLYYHRNHPDKYFKDLRRNLVQIIKLWIKSIVFYNYSSPRKTFRSFFAPVLKTSANN